MVQYHIGDSILFQDQLSNTKFGGNLSVRKPSNVKPLLMFGQDECIFKQYTFTKKAWMNSEGVMPQIPKDEGAGLMISAFASREFGYCTGITEEELQKVNDYRKHKKYSDEIAATNRAGNPNKKLSPLILLWLNLNIVVMAKDIGTMKLCQCNLKIALTVCVYCIRCMRWSFSLTIHVDMPGRDQMVLILMACLNVTGESK